MTIGQEKLAGDWLKRMRKARRVTQGALAQAMGIQQPQVSHIERGLPYNISMDQATAIAQLFDLPLDDVARQLGVEASTGGFWVVDSGDAVGRYLLAMVSSLPKLPMRLLHSGFYNLLEKSSPWLVVQPPNQPAPRSCHLRLLPISESRGSGDVGKLARVSFFLQPYSVKPRKTSRGFTAGDLTTS